MQAVNAHQEDALRLYNQMLLCETFGWTPYEIANLPADFYEATLQILALRAAAEERKKSMKSSPRNNGR